MRLAIPLHGKMSTRSFHAPEFQKALEAAGFEPIYFVGSHYFKNTDVLDSRRYVELQTDRYAELFEKKPLLKSLAQIRRFAVRTETTDLRFRESIERALFDAAPVRRTWAYAAGMDFLRNLPAIGPLALGCERLLYPTDAHTQLFKEQEIAGILAPGMGSFGFWNEGLFAREAKRAGLPVIASITNYDNLVNMGYRGFMPDCLAVWSKQMADDAMRLHHIPAKRIEITGPVQYDRYCAPVGVSREAFLKSKGLDPQRKTIIYAGGVNITRYFEMYRLLVEQAKQADGTLPWNLVIRVYPHFKLLESPGWRVIESLLAATPGVYISNSLVSSSDQLLEADWRRDLRWSDDVDELHALLSHGDVMINHFSTISLEAAIMDLPVIHIGYDEYTYCHTYNSSSAFQQRQTHNCRELRLAASQVVKNPEELMPAVERYLRDRSLEQDERRAYALYECGYLDGKSSERLAAASIRLLRSRGQVNGG